MFSRRWFLLLLLFLVACTPKKTPLSGKLTIGVVTFGESDRSVEQYSELKNHLGSQLNRIIELEPTYNELQAIQQIKGQRWDLVFAPSGLVAIAITENQYTPLFPLEGAQEIRPVIVVLKDSYINELKDLKDKNIALGQPGSATGYYLPLYNLYGLTLASVRLAPTPKIALNWVENEEVDATTMSFAQYNRYRSDFPKTQFRILATDTHILPSGAILVRSELDKKEQEKIKEALTTVSSAITASAGYIPNAPVPNYSYLIGVINKVQPITKQLNETPVHLYEKE
jgi:phosphonate transport system substrate-binding protein